MAITLAAALGACGRGAPQRPPMGPPEVGVVVIRPQNVSLSTVLPGRTSPFAISDVRPQVNGIIKARVFTEGGMVKAGQLLYRIDPAPYQAVYDQAAAQLASAEATLATDKVKAERYKDLVSINGVSKQDYDDANAAFQQAAAAVQQSRAAVKSAKINLDYTRLTAPITGRIGRSLVTQGALVTANQADSLASIQTLDPIYVDITQSAEELLKLRRNMRDGALSGGGPTTAPVSLTLEDGSAYPLKGRLEFADVTVDQTTGAVTLRAVFPNPNAVLLPGMYVRARIEQGVKTGAILAPQQGVTRSQSGEPIATVVGPGDRAQIRKLTTEGTVGDQWLVTSGLQAGDRIIVEGLQRVHPGAPVRPAPASSVAPRGAPAGAPQQP